MMERGEVVWDGVLPRGQQMHESRRKRVSLVMAKESHSVSTDSSLSTMTFSEGGEWEFLGAADTESSLLDLCEASEMPNETLNTVERMLELEPTPYEHCGREETEISQNVRFWQDGFRAGYEAAKQFSSRSDFRRTRELDALRSVASSLVTTE
jgi:hypothetical protein